MESRREATLVEVATGKRIRVHATTEHPASHYGHAVWVDDDGIAYCEVDSKVPNPFYAIDRRGGARKNAGRKRNPDKAVGILTYCPRQTAEAVRALAEAEGMSLSKEVASLLAEALQARKSEKK